MAQKQSNVHRAWTHKHLNVVIFTYTIIYYIELHSYTYPQTYVVTILNLLEVLYVNIILNSTVLLIMTCSHCNLARNAVLSAYCSFFEIPEHLFLLRKHLHKTLSGIKLEIIPSVHHEAVMLNLASILDNKQRYLMQRNTTRFGGLVWW